MRCHGNVNIGEEEGLIYLYAVIGNHDDWDRYEVLRWYTASGYARDNPDARICPKVWRGSGFRGKHT